MARHPVLSESPGWWLLQQVSSPGSLPPPPTGAGPGRAGEPQRQEPRQGPSEPGFADSGFQEASFPYQMGRQISTHCGSLSQRAGTWGAGHPPGPGGGGARATGRRQAEVREPVGGRGLAGAGACTGVRGSHTAQGAGEDWTPVGQGGRPCRQRPWVLPVSCPAPRPGSVLGTRAHLPSGLLSPGPLPSDSTPLLTQLLGTEFSACEAHLGGGGISSDPSKRGCSTRVRTPP